MLPEERVYLPPQVNARLNGSLGDVAGQITNTETLGWRRGFSFTFFALLFAFLLAFGGGRSTAFLGGRRTA